ncbi:hypothetical protein MUO66_07930 [Candidatus Bathyarchaeota archaeon]|nr:hypothetical protein [Candidatus Bathyarchaeota archaeon]
MKRFKKIAFAILLAIFITGTFFVYGPSADACEIALNCGSVIVFCGTWGYCEGEACMMGPDFVFCQCGPDSIRVECPLAQ